MILGASSSVRVFMYREPVDMRNAYDMLSALVVEPMKSLFSGDVFGFRRADEEEGKAPYLRKRASRCRPTTEEEIERASAQLAPELVSEDGAEPVEAPAQIDGVEPDENVDSVGDHRPTPSNASTARSASSRSLGASRRTRH